jgi:hypothetical protein
MTPPAYAAALSLPPGLTRGSTSSGPSVRARRRGWPGQAPPRGR